MSLNRRSFSQTAAAVSLSSTLGLASRSHGSRRIPPSDRLTVGVIGLGARGNQVMKSFLAEDDVQIVAVCDVHDSHYRDRKWGSGAPMGLLPGKRAVERHYSELVKSGVYKGCQAISDYREVIERDDIDAVIVATPDHWHAKIASDAIGSGKDVYGEKPVTHYFAEGQHLYRLVKQHEGVYQVGSQQRSDSRFRRAVEVVRNGHLGKIKRVEVGLPPGYDQAQDSIEAVSPPTGLDYDMWCGPAEKLPYMRARHHRWWRSTRAFGGGVLMDWIGHHNDIAHWGLGQDTGGPESIEVPVWTKAECELYDTPKDYKIVCQYAGGIELVISSELKSGTKWIGENGWLWVNRGKHQASDVQWMKSSFDVGTWRLPKSNGHTRDFLDAVRSRGQCVATAEIGHRSITPGHLAYVASALGRKLTWDAQREVIVNDDSAQDLLMQMPARSPWQL